MDKYTQSERASQQTNNVYRLDIAQHSDGEITTDKDGEMSSNTDFDKRIIAELTTISKELKKRKKIKVKLFLPLYSLLMTAYEDCLDDDSSEEEAECDQQTMDEFLKILERKLPAKWETPQPRSILPEREMDKQSKTRSTSAKLPDMSPTQINKEEAEEVIRALAKIPLIMLHDKPDYTYVSDEVSENNIAMSALNMKNGIRMTFRGMDDYFRTSSYLREMGFYHHSYASIANESLDVVIRGIPMSMNLEDIMTKLENKGYPVLNAFRMTRGIRNNQTPLIVLSLEKTKKAREIYKLKKIFWCYISVEGILRTADDVQCQRCKRFGHSTVFCFACPDSRCRRDY